MAQFPIDIRIDTSDASKLGPLNRQLNETDKSATGAATASRALSAAIATVASAATLGQVVRLSDSYTKIQNSIVNVVSSTEELTARTGDLLQISLRSRASFEATAGLYGKLKRATDDLGLSQERVLNITETINKSFAANKGSAAASAAAIEQLGQALNAGVLRGDEFNSIADQAPAILRAVIAETGMASKELREFAATGGITAELLIRSIEGYAETIAREFDKTKATFDEQIQRANNLATAWVGSSEAIQDASKTAGAVLVTMTENLDTLVDVAGAAAVLIGARLVGALAAKRAATVAANAATVNALQLEQAEAAAVLRRAEAEKAAAAIQLKAARDVTAAKQAHAVVEAQLSVVSETRKLSDVADAARLSQVATAAEVDRLKATLSNITAEQALEKQRLAAQISERGRIDTSTRMAALGRDRTVVAAQLAAAEKALAVSTTQVTAAETAATASRQKQTAATVQLAASSATVVAAKNAESLAVERAAIAAQAATAATARLTIAQTAAAAASSVLAAATRAASAAMAFLGGPVGVAIIAASALLYFGSSAEKAGKQARESQLADEVKKLTENYESLSRLGQREIVEDLTRQQIALNEQLTEANRQLDAAKEKQKSAVNAPGQSFVPGVSGLQAVTDASTEVNRLQTALDETQAKLNALLQTRAPDAAKWIEPKVIADTLNFYDEMKLKLEQQIQLIGLTEVEQARLQARQELLNKATKEGVTLTEAQVKAYTDLAAQAVVKQQQEEADRYVLTLAKQVAAQRDVGVQESINANLSRLSASATDDQRQQVEALTRSLYAHQEAERSIADLNAVREIGVAEADPLTKLEEELRYKQELLFNAYYESAIMREDDLFSQQEYNERLLNLDKEYADKRAQVQNSTTTARLNAERAAQAQLLGLTGDVFGQIADKIAEAKGKESNAYKAAFIASKAAAIAQAVIQTELSATAALAPPPIGLGPVAGLPYSQVIRGLGYASVGLIAGQAIAGFANGGPVSGPGTGRSDSIPAFLSNGEYVMPAQRTDQYRNELDAMRRGTFSARQQQSSATNVTIINNVSDVADVAISEGPDGELIATIDRRISDRVPQMMAQEAGDPYSRFTKSMNNQYTLGRR